jgi:putative transcriptional regulator
VALIVASHLALSPESRRRYRAYEALGGALLERIEPDACAPDAWERLLARLDDADREPAPTLPPVPESLRSIPSPLRRHLPGSLDALPWYRKAEALQADLRPETPGWRTTLIKVPAGRPYPRHDHAGTELILVLDGAFRDRSGRHIRGELVIAGAGEEHAPVAEPERDWLWLRVLDAPLRPKSPLTRLRGLLRPL